MIGGAEATAKALLIYVYDTRPFKNIRAGTSALGYEGTEGKDVAHIG